MGFLVPKVPSPTPAPPPPVRSDPAVTEARDTQRQQDAQRRRRSATIVAEGVTDTPTVIRPQARSGAQLLGQV